MWCVASLFFGFEIQFLKSCGHRPRSIQLLCLHDKQIPPATKTVIRIGLCTNKDKICKKNCPEFWENNNGMQIYLIKMSYI